MVAFAVAQFTPERADALADLIEADPERLACRSACRSCLAQTSRRAARGVGDYCTESASARRPRLRSTKVALGTTDPEASSRLTSGCGTRCSRPTKSESCSISCSPPPNPPSLRTRPPSLRTTLRRRSDVLREPTPPRKANRQAMRRAKELRVLRRIRFQVKGNNRIEEELERREAAEA